MSSTTWSNVVSGAELDKVAKDRKLEYHAKKHFASSQDDYIADGWTVIKKFKDSKYLLYGKKKPADELFEDQVWTMLHMMGFSDMNKDRTFKMSYDPHNDALTKQVDVFAVEDDVILIIECKCSDSLKTGVFKTDLEALHGNMEGLRREALSKFPGRRVKFIWATKNYMMSAKDLERMQEWQILHFDDNMVQYYTKLATLLGSSARYQLLGNILAGTEIKNLEVNVPAIQSKMGNITYYEFSIEPAKLLKISYVLHRVKANAEMMPAYQRMIVQSRLADIRKFVNNGGYFPNSIIVSLDTHDRHLRFDPANTQVEGTKSRVGILHLPNQYHSAYIIDGQHRLYGYTGSPYAQTDCIPVVAFEDLDRASQLKMFMDINENQKAVPKSLRTILNKDVYWESPKQSERRVALCSKLALQFGEDTSSPLYNRVVIDEDNPTTDIRCITVAVLQTAINKAKFFNDYDKTNTVKSYGSFDLDNIETTGDRLFRFLCLCLSYFMEECPDQWERGNRGGVLTINRGIQAVIRIVGDLLAMLEKDNKVHVGTDSSEKIFSELEPYLAALAEYIAGLTDEESTQIRSTLGTNADRKFLCYFQKAIHEACPDYDPDGLADYFENETKKYNEEARKALASIQTNVHDIVVGTLLNNYGMHWLKTRVPKTTYSELSKEASDLNYDSDGPERTAADCISLDHLKSIATYASNWDDVFRDIFTRPEDEESGSDPFEWVGFCKEIITKMTKPTYSVRKDDYEQIRQISEWLESKVKEE